MDELINQSMNKWIEEERKKREEMKAIADMGEDQIGGRG